MGPRMPLVQIIGVVVLLLGESVLSMIGVGMVLAEVRLLLLMVLAVALGYLSLMQRRPELAAVRERNGEDAWFEHERGA